jgi:hypothetical protein
VRIAFRSFNGADDWAWVNSHVGIQRVEDTGGIIAVDEDTGNQIGACIFDNWTANSVQTHFVVANPLVFRHGIMDVCYGFVFDTQGRKYMYGLVPGDNAKAIKLNKHMGWTVKAVLEEAFAPNIDYILMQLTKETWEERSKYHR